MEDQENYFREENSIKNETEISSLEYDTNLEQNETEPELDFEIEKKQTIKELDDKKINDKSYAEKQEKPETKTETKSIEILDLNQRSADDVDRPFSFSPKQVSKLEKDETFIDSKLNETSKEDFTSNKKCNREEFFPDNTDQSVLGLNSQKLTKSTSISDSTELKLRKKFLVYQREPQKTQFKNLSEQNLFKSINRLSALPNRNIEPFKVKTIHDRVKDIDIDAVSIRLYNSKIHGHITMNEFYNSYFVKNIRPADPLIVSERLSAKKDTRVPDSCRTIKSSPLKRNDLCVSFAWRGYN